MPQPMDKSGESGLHGSQIEGGTSSAPDGQTDETYLATFKTKEDAAKGWEAAQAEINRLRSEKDKAAARASRHDEMLEKLTALQEASLNAGKPQKQPFDKDAFIRQWEEGDASFQVSALENLIADTAAKEELEALRKEVQQTRAELSAKMGEYDPTYQAHKDTVAVLKEQFPEADTQTLVKFAIYADSLKPSAPQGDVPPGRMASGRAAEPATTATLTPEAQAKLSKSIPGGLRKGELEAALARLSRKGAK